MQRKQIIYFSDAAVSQYKNRKKFCKLIFHNADFGIAAGWHFFVTAHEESPCDNVGETLKKLAARVSLQGPQTDKILTPAGFYNWAQQIVRNIAERIPRKQTTEKGKRY